MIRRFRDSQICRLLFLTLVTLLLLSISSNLAWSQEVEIPQPINYVSDYAQVLDEATETQLNALLKELEEKTTAEVAVLTVRTTEPWDIFDYGMEVFDRWKLGKEGKDNGLLFLVAVEDREMYIFTGYGLEGILPDGRIGEIRDEEIIPYFKLEDYAGGIKNGVETIAGIIAQDAGVELRERPAGGEPANPRGNDIRTALIVLLVIFFFLYWLFFRRRGQRRLGGGGWLFPWVLWWGGSRARGSRGFGGGFSGGSFGGFGGGTAGGGGAGGSW